MTTPTPETLRDRVAIQRYDMEDHSTYNLGESMMERFDNGDYVLYADHLAAIAAIPKLSPECRETIEHALRSLWLDCEYPERTAKLKDIADKALAELQALP